MAKRSDKIPQSVFARTSRLLFSGAKIAVREVAGRMGAEDSKLASRIKQTEELVATLGQLKGAAMKAGQLVSLEFSDILPPEVVAILRQLHDSGTFMPFDQVRYILGRELGAERLSMLEDISPEPIAAASIGQVHKARLNNQDVAVKVQFPGVANSIDSDLNVLRKLVSMAIQLRGTPVDMDPIFAAIAASLKREADYRLEAANADAYRHAIASQGYVIPTVFHDFTSSKVLCLSYESGVRIADWISTKPAKAEAQHFATLILNLLIDELMTHGIMQTDPNFGNFLYRPDSGELVLLDFGATNLFPTEFRRILRRIIHGIMTHNFDDVIAVTLDQGYLSREESLETLAHFRELIMLVTQMMQPQFQPFKFRNDDWLKSVRDLAAKFALSVKHSAPPHQLIFLNRKLSGMYHLLKDLDVEVEMMQFLDRGLAANLD
ncbi:MAG: AarF/ABC1/UbiB kinase family protein [Deltaproteobacteria bacterium]|nr:AarF/ABC1/UbiB kinase family protein [Deltaproteobacteria bacterium]